MTEEKINCEDIEQEQGGMKRVPPEQECRAGARGSGGGSSRVETWD